MPQEAWAKSRAKSSPHPVDAHVGQRLRLVRVMRRMSQDMLGQLVGVTFQQVQKYERGANRITASRLYDLARALDVHITYFFDDMSARTKVEALATSPFKGHGAAGEVDDLVELYYAIPDDRVRRRIYDLTKAVAEAG